MTWGADPGGTSALLEDLGGVGPSLHYMVADLERPEAVTELVDATIERFGSIDIIIANHARSSTQAFADVSVEELDRCWAINARSCVLLTRLLAERRDPGPGGRVVYFTSGQHIGPMPNEIAYAISFGIGPMCWPDVKYTTLPPGPGSRRSASSLVSRTHERALIAQQRSSSSTLTSAKACVELRA